ncbi:MAG: hypothetical protein R3C52_09845 [Hyphomonadaceae bacterium]
MQFSRRRSPPFRLIAIAIGVVAVVLIGGVFWFAHQAEQNPPEQQDIRIEAENVSAG